MSSQVPAFLNFDTQGVATLAQIPFASPEAGVIETADNFAYDRTGQALIIPLLAADPPGNPPANTVKIYAVLSAGNYTIRLKRSDGTVMTTANLT